MGNKQSVLQTRRLLIAVDQNDIDEARAALSSGAKLTGCTENGFTALHLAALRGNADICKLLLSRGMMKNAFDSEYRTALHLACMEGHVEVCKVLIEAQIFLNAGDSDDWTALHYATRQGNEQIVALLLQAKANPNIAEGKQDLAPLHFAAIEGKADLCQILIKGGAKVDALTKSLKTPLMIAAKLGHTNVCMAFIQNGADINKQDEDNWNALHAAVSEDKKNICSILIRAHIELDVGDHDGATPLFRAALSGNVEIVKLLLNAGATADFPNVRGETSLHAASYKGNKAVCEVLIEKGANVKAECKVLTTPLHLAAQENHIDICKLLISKGALVDATSLNIMTPLQSATKNNSFDTVKFLLENKADPNIKDADDWSSLNFASAIGNEKITKILIEYGADPNTLDKDGDSALFTAAFRGNIDICILLLDKGANLETKNKKQERPLHAAAYKGFDGICNEMLKRGAAKNPKCKNSLTPMHLAAQEGHKIVLEVLLAAGCNPNSKSKQGYTPLHLANLNGHDEVKDVLIQGGADPNAKSKQGQTPDQMNVFGNFRRRLLEGNDGQNADVGSTDISNLLAMLLVIGNMNDDGDDDDPENDEDEEDDEFASDDGVSRDILATSVMKEFERQESIGELQDPGSSLSRNRKKSVEKLVRQLSTNERIGDSVNEKRQSPVTKKILSRTPSTVHTITKSGRKCLRHMEFLIAYFKESFPKKKRMDIMRVIDQNTIKGQVEMEAIADALLAEDKPAAKSKRESDVKYENLETYRKRNIDPKMGEIMQINRLESDTKLMSQVINFYKPRTMNLRKQPKVIFQGELGLDFGAVTSEFFTWATTQFQNGFYNGIPLFEGATEHRLPTADEYLCTEGIFRCIGNFIGHSILHGGPGFWGLSPAVKFYLSNDCSRENLEKFGAPLSVDDVPYLDKQEIISELKSNVGKLSNSLSEKVTNLLFEANSNLVVNEGNREFAINRLILFFVYEKRSNQLEDIREGLQEVSLYSFLCINTINVKSVFPSVEDMKIPASMILRAISATYATKQHKCYNFFLKFISDLESDKIKDLTVTDLLRFWTGSIEIPSSSTKEFLVEIGTNDLPISHACSFQIDIPGTHSNYDSFSKAFQTALVHGSAGFGAI